MKIRNHRKSVTIENLASMGYGWKSGTIETAD